MLIVLILIALILLIASAVLSAAETAVMLLPAGRVHRLVESGVTGAGALDELVENRHRLRAVSALLAGLASGFSAIAGWWAAVDLAFGLPALALSDGFMFLGAVVALVLGVLVTHALAQALPRTLAASNPEKVGLQSARIALPVVRLLHPIARALAAPWRWAAGLFDEATQLTPWAVTPEWRGSDGDEENEREEAEEALLEAVSDFAEKVAREVMVPRTDVASLADTATIGDAIALIHRTGFSRLPIYHESMDDVRGVLYAKDLLVALGRSEAPPDIARIARSPFFVPETKPVEELLLEMRTRTHIAIVADEYGGTAGIVTLEDLLEEIVGEISDEYDRDEPLLVELGEGRYRVDARLPVDDLNELFGTDLDTEADSVGGLFTEMVGRIPELGESMELEGLRLTVTDRQGTRVRELTVEPAPRAEGDTSA